VERYRRHSGWVALLTPEWIPSLAVLLGGVLLHSMNVLLVATMLPSIVAEVGGAALMSWPTTAYLACSIVAATCTGLATAAVGPGRAFAGGALVYCVGTLLCAFAPAMGQVIAGRFVQGGGGGLLSAVAYVVVRGTFPESLWPRVFALLASVWSISVLYWSVRWWAAPSRRMATGAAHSSRSPHSRGCWRWSRCGRCLHTAPPAGARGHACRAGGSR
jgi:MFS family permease